MRFLTYIECDPAQGPPPAELFEALGAVGAETAGHGVVVDRGGLAPVDRSTHIRVGGGSMKILDGPFAEAKEVIGGYAMYDVRSEDEVLEYARRFMQIHVDTWPEFEGTAVIRQVFDAADMEG
ncbi:MAG: YciI family protein [Aeromicrobium sp.]